MFNFDRIVFNLSLNILKLVHFSDFKMNNTEEGNFNSRPKGLDLMNSNGNVAQLLVVEMLRVSFQFCSLVGTNFLDLERILTTYGFNFEKPNRKVQP